MVLYVVMATGCKKGPDERAGPDTQTTAASVPHAATTPGPPTNPPPALPHLDERVRGCNTENVQNVVRAQREAVTRCYRKVLDKNDAANGRLSIEIDIDKTGTAKFLGVKADDFHDEEFTRCVFAVLKPLAYPIPDGEPCIIVYPFVFSASAAPPK